MVCLHVLVARDLTSSIPVYQFPSLVVEGAPANGRIPALPHCKKSEDLRPNPVSTKPRLQ